MQHPVQVPANALSSIQQALIQWVRGGIHSFQQRTIALVQNEIKARQTARFVDSGARTNADLDGDALERFAEPDEALEVITDALVGMGVDSSVGALAAAVSRREK